MQQSTAIEQEAAAIADSLIARHGPSAQNVAAQSLSDAVTANDLAGYKKWLAVRKNILDRGDTIRYTRRLSDKLIWAIEQSLELDLPQLAAVLGVIAVEARKAEQQIADDVRAFGNPRPPLGGAINTDEPEYTRRLSDKLIWALQQSVDQGQIDIATMLKPLYEVAAEGDAARAAEYKARNS